MFRTSLLVSTAMTAVALLLSGAPTGAYAQTDMHVASRDPNMRFLCTYGQFRVSAHPGERHSSQFFSYWTHVAVPIIGHGQTVTSVKVIEAQSTYTSNSSFTTGIYSNNASGFPGKQIAVGIGKIGKKCGPVTISIPATTLKPNTKYWIEETTSGSSYNQPNVLYWIANPEWKHKAYVQKYTATLSGSSTTPWTKQTTGPYFKLK